MPKKLNTTRHVAILFHTPTIIILTLITMVPLFYNLRMSLYGFKLSVVGSRDMFVGLRNYIELFNDTEYWHSMLVTVKFVVASTLLQLILGLVFALILDHLTRGSRLLTSLVITPMMVAPLIVGLMYSFILNPQFGLYVYIVDLLKLPLSHAPLSKANFALLVLILTDVWEWTPFMILMILAALRAAPVEPYEAAMIDGADYFQRLRYITLPLIKPVILVATILRGIEAFKVFDKPYILTGGGPGAATEVIDMFTYREAFINYNFGYAAALCVVLFIVLISAGIMYWRFIMGIQHDE
jgi:multiple sugar transport system permease protein